MKGRNNDLEELTEQQTAGLRVINEWLQQETGESRYHRAQADGGGIVQTS
ncbi:MAG: hypothetical protein OIN66_16110 [Candidatus Methanoperedens sp.]|nr:hypothetical protein [Candidatus Methanoperedens sp.]